MGAVERSCHRILFICDFSSIVSLAFAKNRIAIGLNSTWFLLLLIDEQAYWIETVILVLVRKPHS